MAHLELTFRRPEIAVITLNRPEKLNALSSELVETLHTLDRIAADNDCRVVILTGAGRGFCAGLHLTDPNPSAAAAGTEFPRSGMRWQERIANLTVKLHRLRQRVIAAVNGAALWLWKIRPGIDQTGAVGQSRRRLSGDRLARQEPQSDLASTTGERCTFAEALNQRKN